MIILIEFVWVSVLTCFLFTIGDMFIKILNNLREEGICIIERGVNWWVVLKILFQEFDFEDDLFFVGDLVLSFDMYLIIVLNEVKVHKNKT